MKLFNSILALAALDGVYSATPTCSTKASTFALKCTSKQFEIKVNHKCIEDHYSNADVSKSFVWGDKSHTTMDDPSGSSATHVDATAPTTVTCPNAKGSTDSSKKMTVFSIPFDNCKASYDPTTKTYAIYWNQGLMATSMGQQKFVCNYKQESKVATLVGITYVANADEETDIIFPYVLSFQKGKWPTSSVNNEYKSLSYSFVDSPSANIGDLVNLKITTTETGSKFVPTLYECWATLTTPKADFASETADEKVQLYNDMCPNYSWVGPRRYGASKTPAATDKLLLSEYFNKPDTAVDELRFRQFGFITKLSEFAAGKEISYACRIKICRYDTTITACLGTKWDGSTTIPTCSPSTTGRRRRDVSEEGGKVISISAVVPAVTPEDCAEVDPDNSNICRRRRDNTSGSNEQGKGSTAENDKDKSGSACVMASSALVGAAILGGN